MTWGEPGAPGPVALVGSGEYLPVMTDIETELLAGRPPRFVQLATAAAPEGSASLAYWHDLGRLAAERLGVAQVVLPVVDRASADDPAIASLVVGAGLVYLSGGNPRFLADTLRGSAVWAAVEDAWRGGAALAGCSAGAMAMAAEVPDVFAMSSESVPGLGVVPGLAVIPHFDRLGARLLQAAGQLDDRGGAVRLGIDEGTAVVGGPTSWRVLGRQSAWVLGDARVEHPAGSVLELAGA